MDEKMQEAFEARFPRDERIVFNDAKNGYYLPDVSAPDRVWREVDVINARWEAWQAALSQASSCTTQEVAQAFINGVAEGASRALRTHENGGQESEAGAILYMAKNLHSKSYATSRSKAEAELFLLQSGLKVDGKEAAVIPLYLAPPSAPAIETAAIMKCAEALREQISHSDADGQEEQQTYKTLAIAIKQILALIPQDGRTQLESLLAECRKEVRKEAYKEALEVAQEYGIEGINRELRRMAEGEKN